MRHPPAACSSPAAAGRWCPTPASEPRRRSGSNSWAHGMRSFHLWHARMRFFSLLHIACNLLHYANCSWPALTFQLAAFSGCSVSARSGSSKILQPGWYRGDGRWAAVKGVFTDTFAQPGHCHTPRPGAHSNSSSQLGAPLLVAPPQLRRHRQEVFGDEDELGVWQLQELLCGRLRTHHLRPWRPCDDTNVSNQGTPRAAAAAARAGGGAVKPTPWLGGCRSKRLRTSSSLLARLLRLHRASRRLRRALARTRQRHRGHVGHRSQQQGPQTLDRCGLRLSCTTPCRHALRPPRSTGSRTSSGARPVLHWRRCNFTCVMSSGYWDT